VFWTLTEAAAVDEGLKEDFVGFGHGLSTRLDSSIAG